MRGDPFLVNRDWYGLLSQSWNGDLLKKEPEWLSWLKPTGERSCPLWFHQVLALSSFFTFWFPLLVHPSGWHQSCIRQQVCFLSAVFLNFVSDMPCSFSGEFYCALLLVCVGETVQGYFHTYVCWILNLVFGINVNCIVREVHMFMDIILLDDNSYKML